MLKQVVPWPAKIAAKIVLSRLPVPYGLWKKLSLFEHGFMDDPAYVVRVVGRHLEHLPPERRAAPFTALELGPGDSLAAALLLAGAGAGRIYLVDVGPFANREIDKYKALARAIARSGVPVPDIGAARSVEDMLDRCKAVYLTEGLKSLATIPAGTVDLIFSQAVLEHVRAREFLPIMAELRRVSSPGGVSSHRVDLKDHLAGALNNLRFSDRIWESDLFSRSGFYTNRIRHAPMIELFERAGFVLEAEQVDRWPDLPTPRRKLAEPFRILPHDELRISGFQVVLRPGPRAQARLDGGRAA